MGEKDDDDRATRRIAFGRLKTSDKVPDAICRGCGKNVLFSTNGSGRLVALHPVTLRVHPCINP